MKFLNWLVWLYTAHGQKIMSSLTMIVAGLPQIADLVPEADKPYWAAANLILGALMLNKAVQFTRAQNSAAPPA